MQFFSRYNPVVVPEMNYGRPEIPGVNPYKLGSGDDVVNQYERFGPEPDPSLFQDFLNEQSVIRLDPRKLQIPEPSSSFKSFPGYSPSVLPGAIDSMILRGGFGVS
jgi:hypothetical protein